MRAADARGTLGGTHIFPVFLPDGRHFLYLRRPDGLVVGSLDAAPDGQPIKTVLDVAHAAHYAPQPASRVGRMLFVRDSTLFVRPFDPDRLEFAGDAVPMAGNIGTFYNNAYFSISANGRLVYRTADSNSVQLTWFDRRGHPVAEVGEPVFPLGVSVSPDGRRAVFSNLVTPYGLMSMDLQRGTTSRVADNSSDFGVVWSPDSERIVFIGRGGLYQRVLNGAEGQQMLLPSSGREQGVWDWSRDGRFILYSTVSRETERRELWALPLERARKPVTLGHTGSEARFSPDGRWFAYVSDETGRNEIYVRPFNPSPTSGSREAGAQYTMSRGNVAAMLGWSDDGRELWYVTPDLTIMSVALRLDRIAEAGEPMPLFQMPQGIRAALPGMRALSTDGERFLIGVPTRRSTQVPFTVVLNWPTLMRN